MAIKKLPSTGDAPRATGVPESLRAGGDADSAGFPWAGRTFDHHETAFAGDEGEAPAGLHEALIAFREESVKVVKISTTQPRTRDETRVLAERAQQVIVEASASRLLVPMLAEAGETGLTPEGRVVEKSQELSIVTLATPDRRRALPVFTSIEKLRSWNAHARPIPVAGPQAALAAVQDDTDVLVIDPADAQTEFAIRRPAVKAMALGETWVPSWSDATVTAEICEAAVADEAIERAAVSLGDPEMRLRAAELDVWIGISRELSQPELHDVLGRMQQKLATMQVVADRVDSLRLKPVSA